MIRFLPLLILTGLLFGQDIKYDPDIGEPIDVENIESSTFDLNTLPKDFVSKQEIVNMSEEEKGFLYGKYKINPFGNTLISVLIPTLGYYRINQWKQRGRNCIYIYFTIGVALEVVHQIKNIPESFSPRGYYENNAMLDSFASIYLGLYAFDVYNQTKKYNRNLYKYIFGEEE